MDATKVDVLLKTLKIGSMKMAAQQLNYTQSGLLYMINSLEDDLGLSILTRTRKGISLNDMGEALLPYFESLVTADTRLMQKAQELSKSFHSLRIGVLPCVSASIFPEILKNFMADNPDVSIDVQVIIKDMIRSLDLGNIDVAILPKYAAGKYPYYPLISTYFCAAVPANSIPPEQTTITIEEFEKYPLILSAYNPENVVFAILSQSDIQHSIRCSVQDGTPLLAMVAQGLGATHLSALYMNECPENVRMLPFDPVYQYDIGMVVRPVDERKSLIQDFIQYAQASCEAYPSEVFVEE